MIEMPPWMFTVLFAQVRHPITTRCGLGRLSASPPLLPTLATSNTPIALLTAQLVFLLVLLLIRLITVNITNTILNHK